MYEIIPKNNKYRYVDLLMIADVSTCLQMLAPIFFCHPALSFRLVSSQGPKMNPRWWHHTKIAMYHVPILERGGNVSHNPRLSTVVLMLGMTLCALFSANQPLTRGEQWPYWFLPVKFILWRWGRPPVRLSCLTRIKQLRLERARWSSLDMELAELH